MHSKTGRYVGLLYIAPALAFVVAFTLYPLAQMVWMSLHNWSLIAAKKYVGAGNFIKAWNDPQVLDLARVYTEIHRPDHTDPDGARVYDRSPDGGEQAA